MIKLILVLFAFLGAMFLMNAYCPQAWSHGFTVLGQFISYAVIALLLIGYLAFKRVS